MFMKASMTKKQMANWLMSHFIDPKAKQRQEYVQNITTHEQMDNYIQSNLFALTFVYHFDDIIFRLPHMTNTKNKSIKEQVIDTLEKDFYDAEYGTGEPDFPTFWEKKITYYDIYKPPYHWNNPLCYNWRNRFDFAKVHYREEVVEKYTDKYLGFLQYDSQVIPIHHKIYKLLELYNTFTNNRFTKYVNLYNNIKSKIEQEISQKKNSL